MEGTTIYFTRITEQINFKQFEKYLNILPSKEQSRILRYRSWGDQLRCLMGISLIVHFVFKGDISLLKTLIYNYFGKPYTVGNSFFNISHAGDFVIIAVSEEFEMGIDVEEIMPITLLDFKLNMTEFEWKRISSCLENQDEEFYRYWTQKEAVIKAVGKGLSIPLESFEIIELKTVIAENSYYLKELDINKNYCCHIATTDYLLNISEPIFIESNFLLSSL
jgi:4'-phosphopantetheinyl transferase